jgi:hypothetical protein
VLYDLYVICQNTNRHFQQYYLGENNSLHLFSKLKASKLQNCKCGIYLRRIIVVEKPQFQDYTMFLQEITCKWHHSHQRLQHVNHYAPLIPQQPNFYKT